MRFDELQRVRVQSHVRGRFDLGTRYVNEIHARTIDYVLHEIGIVVARALTRTYRSTMTMNELAAIAQVRSTVVIVGTHEVLCVARRHGLLVELDRVGIEVLLSQLALEPVQIECAQFVRVLVLTRQQRRRFVKVLHVDEIAHQMFQIDDAYQVEIGKRFDALLANQKGVHIGLVGHEFVMCGDLFDCSFVYHLYVVVRRLVQALIALRVFELFASQRQHFVAMFVQVGFELRLFESLYFVQQPNRIAIAHQRIIGQFHAHFECAIANHKVLLTRVANQIAHQVDLDVRGEFAR